MATTHRLATRQRANARLCELVRYLRPSVGPTKEKQQNHHAVLAALRLA